LQTVLSTNATALAAKMATVYQDGSFKVTNTRSNFSKTYKAGR